MAIFTEKDYKPTTVTLLRILDLPDDDSLWLCDEFGISYGVGLSTHDLKEIVHLVNSLRKALRECREEASPT